MSRDEELKALRAGVSCAVLLEQLPPTWQLDKRESTRNCLKYRRGQGEIIIVTHQGRGWWDPGSSAKGDVIALVQHLDQRLSLGEVRKVLRPLAGISPSFTEHLRDDKPTTDIPVAARWSRRQPIRRGDAAWRYLAEARGIPPDILFRAAAADAVRHGAYGNAWFAHRSEDLVTHVEIRGPEFKGSLRGGSKTLFRFGAPAAMRLAVLEAPIDALSLAALEQRRTDTLYVATGGGMGPGTLIALRDLLQGLQLNGGDYVCGTDANRPGDRYAERHAELAERAGVRFVRLRPPDGSDWNDVLKGRGA